MKEAENTFEVKIPTRASRNTKIRISADNHLLALKRAVKNPSARPFCLGGKGRKWQVGALIPGGKALGLHKKEKKMNA